MNGQGYLKSKGRAAVENIKCFGQKETDILLPLSITLGLVGALKKNPMVKVGRTF
jgi:hypothetical protein